LGHLEIRRNTRKNRNTRVQNYPFPLKFKKIIFDRHKNNNIKKLKRAGRLCLMSNPSYSGGREKEDRGLKSAQANSSGDRILKNPSQKGLAEWLKVKALSSSPSTAKTTNK
jgi:hypothetical protein